MKVSFLLILITSALLLGGANLSANESQLPNPAINRIPGPNNAAHNGEQNITPTNSRGTSIADKPHTPTQAQQNNEEKPKEQTANDLQRALVNYQWWLNVFTFGLVIVGLITAIVLVLQMCFLWGTMKATKQAAKAAADNAKAGMLSQRAQIYASPRKENALGFTYGGMKPSLIVEVRNVGLTPAYNCTFDRWVAVVHDPANYEFPKEPSHFKDPKGVIIFPKETYPPGIEIPFAAPLESQDVHDWKVGKKELWFRVRFDYTDIFDKPRYVDLGWAYFEGKTENPRMLPKYHDAN